MKKIVLILFLIITITISASCNSGEEKTESYLRKGSVINYKEIPYFYFDDPIEYYKNDEGYVDYYEQGKKEYIINEDNDKYIYKEYLDGIEIIMYDGWNPVVEIPEEIDGKPVIKLSGYLDDTDLEQPFYEWGSCFNNKGEIEEIIIPSAVKEIVNDVFDIGHIKKIEVSKDNPYYSSKNGILYNKDGTIELCVPNCYSECSFYAKQ